MTISTGDLNPKRLPQKTRDTKLSEIAQREREAAGQRKARIEAMSEGNAPDGKA